MRNPRRTLLTLAAALLGAPSAWASAAGPEIRIGASAALSGPAAGLGQRFHAGAGAYFNQLNAQGGIGGARVVVDLLDDAYESDKADLNTRKLVEDPRVLALFGYVGTPTSNMALPYVKRWSIPFVGAYTGADVLRSPYRPLVFNVRASYREEAQQLAVAMKIAGIHTLNVFYQADLFGRAGLEAMRAVAGAQGLQILATDTVKRNTAEVAEAVEALVQASPADAIFMVSTYASSAAFVRQARAKGFRGRFYALSFAGMEQLRHALGKPLAKGLTVAQVVPDPEDRALPVVAEYQQAMREAGDRQFDSISLEGYLAAKVMAEGLRRAKAPLTRESLAQGLESVGQLDLGGFHVHFGPGQRNGSSLVELRVLP
ncbi:ABC transporter substrate-binding protein [Pelomonas sp. SE-A7]|uniref:ABC transporter substrate-binding protein n=1 Tax=Pelomonas sp. SE-A7 TaxID=3054953 RepID=UPI00259D1F46|nr:ABC transporter substrate-binding protein [Pelomonas sp. SE-A7]MDM4768528.1 ABC transporter substrate-binding protein [Pelomonas sp. SE-A7]